MSRLLALVLFLALTAVSCSNDDPRVDSASEPTTSPALEAITAQGIAGVVRDVIGADLIESYTQAGEEDSIGVLVQLAGRQVLVVTVQTAGAAPITSCDDLKSTAMGAGDCAVDEDGTITASGTAEPFSDDNTRGSTVLAQSVNPGTGRVVYALYETYSRQAGLDVATLAEIVSDPALAASTDPATNDAGADIELSAQPG